MHIDAEKHNHYKTYNHTQKHTSSLHSNSSYLDVAIPMHIDAESVIQFECFIYESTDRVFIKFDIRDTLS
jgi:hypothetical protein